MDAINKLLNDGFDVESFQYKVTIDRPEILCIQTLVNSIQGDLNYNVEEIDLTEECSVGILFKPGKSTKFVRLVLK